MDLALEAIRFASCLVFLGVAASLLRKPVSKEAEPAQAAFAIWWAGLALVGVLSIPAGLGVSIASAGLLASRVYIYLLFAMLFGATSGLVVYLAYLYTGRYAYGLAGVLGAGLLAFTGYLVEAHQPYIATADGVANLAYAVPHPDWAIALFGVVLVLPLLGGALGYCALFFRVQDEHARLRIVLVGFGILLWFAHSLATTVLTFLVDLDRTAFLPRAVGQVLGVLAAAVIAWAFLPSARREGASATA